MQATRHHGVAPEAAERRMTMVKCGEDCSPCCDYCKYVVHEVIEFESGKGIGGPIFCKLQLDEERRQLARRCSCCEDFWCMNAEKEES